MLENLRELACCLYPFVYIALIAAAIFLLWRAWNLRGFVSDVAMDGATFHVAKDGSAVIKYGWARHRVYLVILAGGLVGAMALVVISFHDTWRGIAGAWSILMALGYTLGLLLLLWTVVNYLVPALRMLARSQKRPPLHFDTRERAIRIGSDASAERVPFSSIRNVAVSAPYQEGFGPPGMVKIRIGLVLQSGQYLDLGTVSGTFAGTRKRAEVIAGQIAALIGLPEDV